MAGLVNMQGLPQMRRPSINPLVLVFIVVAVLVFGTMLVMRFSKSQEERELMHWQNKLNLIADSRSMEINNWMDTQFKELGEVTTNPSLQLYLADLLGKSREKGAEEPAQAVFIRNLLVVTADRLHYIDKSRSELQSVHANVKMPSGTGLAIIDSNGAMMVSTAGLGALDSELSKKIASLPKNRPALIDAYSTASGQLRVGFVFPIYPIQQDASTAQPVAQLVGVKNLDDNFFAMLHHPGVTEKTLEGFLVQREGDSVVFLQ